MIQLITIVIVLLTYDCAAKNIQRFVPVVIAKIPHDPTTFTQGLSIIDDLLYESIGLYGQSQLRRINLLTGKIEKEFFLSLYLFAEGIVAFPILFFILLGKRKRPIFMTAIHYAF